MEVLCDENEEDTWSAGKRQRAPPATMTTPSSNPAAAAAAAGQRKEEGRDDDVDDQDDLVDEGMSAIDSSLIRMPDSELDAHHDDDDDDNEYNEGDNEYDEGDYHDEDDDDGDADDDADDDGPTILLPASCGGTVASSDVLSGGEELLTGGAAGRLGPLLRDLAVERAKQRHPRVLCIGDVHGCVDELQDLLRRCDYQPGDAIVFLGDLVAKGPDSCGVVQMAQELGALGVRGNHEYEVIRWHHALGSGMKPPAIGGEHYHLACALPPKAMEWVKNCPWYIHSNHLQHTFVHAGMVAGLRLQRQNPRLMMNMRSVLPDGTVTAKHFSNWPWARLWGGPSTVVFGHDADRGLQFYDKAMGIDTGCVYGGRLTAYILPEKKLVSVGAKKQYLAYKSRGKR